LGQIKHALLRTAQIESSGNYHSLEIVYTDEKLVNQLKQAPFFIWNFYSIKVRVLVEQIGTENVHPHWDSVER
jgi:hypothetical protein